MKNNKFLHLFCSILSTFLFVYAPENFDYLFIVICFALFLLQALIVLKKDIQKDSVLNFNVLFLFSFFCVSYAFPLLIWGTPMFQREGIQAYINYDVASKCAALCTLAISVYFFSYQLFQNKSYTFGGISSAKKLYYVKIFYIIAYFGLLYNTINYMRTVGGIAVDVGIWYNIFLAALPLSLIYNCERYKVITFWKFVKKNFLILLSVLILAVLFIILGDRGLVMISSIIVVGVYSFKVKRIKPGLFLLGILLGSLLMYSLKVTRTSESSLSKGDTTAYIEASNESLEGANLLTLFSDLTQIHHELYLGYEYYNNYGLIEPKQFVIIPFYPFPLLPTLLSRMLFRKSIDEMKPGVILNDFMSYSGHGHFGIHCVIDVFMRYGILGVILIFYLWGYLVSVISGSKEKSIIGFAMFIILLASAIRLPRAPLLEIVRNFFWVFLIVWIARFVRRNYNV